MNTFRTVAIAIVTTVVLVFAIVAGGLWLYTSWVYEDSYTSGYEYEIALEANGTLEDVTLYVPLAAHDDGSELGELIVAGDAYERSEPEGTSPWWYAIVETEHGPMLEISADRIDGAERLFLRTFDEEGRLLSISEITEDEIPDDMTNRDLVRSPYSYTVIAGMRSDESIDTRNPIETEPMLTPKRDVTTVDCGPIRDEIPYIVGERCYSYETAVYASYDADQDTHVDLRIQLEGSNEWWVGGWNSNWYSDFMRLELTGPQDAWITTSGAYSEEGGSYR